MPSPHDELLHQSLDRLHTDLGEIRDDLREHMRRTEAAEARLHLVEDATGKLTAELEPIKSHVALFAAGAKILGGVTLLAGLAVELLKLWGRV